MSTQMDSTQQINLIRTIMRDANDLLERIETLYRECVINRTMDEFFTETKRNDVTEALA